MNVFDSFDRKELKLVYRVLHGQLTQNLDLMDSSFLAEMQHYLQQAAGEDGVDVSDHSQWDNWLGNQGGSCAQRITKRFVVVQDED